MSNCYVFKGVGSDGNTYAIAACASNPQWGDPPPGYPGYFAPYDGTTRIVGWATTQGSITLCLNQAAITAAIGSAISYGNNCGSCIDNPPPSEQHDCINGACTKKNVYGTPGIYSSLEECQAHCSSTPINACPTPNICVSPDYCPPGMVCVPNNEWSQIEGLAGQHLSKDCGGG